VSIGWGVAETGMAGLTSKVKRGSRLLGVAPGDIVQDGIWRGLGCIVAGAYLGSPSTVGEGGLGHDGKQQKGETPRSWWKGMFVFFASPRRSHQKDLYTRSRRANVYDVQVCLVLGYNS
jgi:hypothetical protein